MDMMEYNTPTGTPIDRWSGADFSLIERWLKIQT
jgi:hypothetical protein